MNRTPGPEIDLAHRRIAASLLRLTVSFARPGPRDVGVTASLTLVTLDFCGPQRITELATMEGVSQPSMSGVVSGLERAGLVARERDPGDRRVVLVGLTPEGRRYLERRRDSTIQRLAALIGELSDSEREALIATAPVLERLSLHAARHHVHAHVP